MRLDVVDEAAGGEELGEGQQGSLLVHLLFRRNGDKQRQTREKDVKTCGASPHHVSFLCVDAPVPQPTCTTNGRSAQS